MMANCEFYCIKAGQGRVNIDQASRWITGSKYAFILRTKIFFFLWYFGKYSFQSFLYHSTLVLADRFYEIYSYQISS